MKKETTTPRTVRCSVELDEILKRLAAQENRSVSEVIRDLIYKGLAASGKNIDEDHLYKVVKQAIEEVTRPSVERLAAISAKATQISSASFFMGIYAATQTCDESEQQRIQEAAESARALGIQYLKLKDRDIDTFIRNGTKQIMEE